MVKPLTFKGDKPKKRKTRPEDHPDTPKAPKIPKDDQQQHPPPEEAEDDQTWVSADTPSDISGPVILVLPSTDPPTCIASDANGKVFASEMENMVERDPASAEPHDVRQVWVATRVAGSEGFNFKGHHGRYLSCDNHGILSASASAISHYESFIAIPSLEIPGVFSLQTGGGDKETFLSIREGGKKAGSGSGIDIRGDATTVSFETSIRIRMQARFKPRIKASKEIKAREKVSRKELEGAVGRRLEDDEVKRLRRARREGNFHEEVLDVRTKGKHDKFAW